jgi:hypothetical protein
MLKYNSGSLKLIANSTIKVRQCFEGIKQLTPAGLILQDGREVQADAIILATGYSPMKDTLVRIVGKEVADKCKVGISWDEYKEVPGVSSMNDSSIILVANNRLQMCTHVGRQYDYLLFIDNTDRILIDPGLWSIVGSFALNRPGSLNLALQIKAVEIGVNSEHYGIGTA